MKEKLEEFVLEFLNEKSEEWTLFDLMKAIKKEGLLVKPDFEFVSMLYNVLKDHANLAMCKCFEPNGGNIGKDADIEKALSDMYNYCMKKASLEERDE